MSARTLIGRLPGLSILLAVTISTHAQERERKISQPVVGAAPESTRAQEKPGEAVARLVLALKRERVQPKAAPDRLALHLMDVRTEDVTLIADQPEPGLTHCGSSVWSPDGRRILFDATPRGVFRLSQLKSIELNGEGRAMIAELGTGNCPSFSPTGDRIMFLSNANGVQTGVWLMNADGSGRRFMGDYGRPRWSPYGRHFMIMNFNDPLRVTFMDTNPEKVGTLELPDYKIYSAVSWAGDGAIVAALGAASADTVAVIDVSDAPKGKVKEVVWRRANGPDIEPSYPVYFPATRSCIFVGQNEKGCGLYTVGPGHLGPAKRVGPKTVDREITDLALSPDGHYVLYSAHGPG